MYYITTSSVLIVTVKPTISIVTITINNTNYLVQPKKGNIKIYQVGHNSIINGNKYPRDVIQIDEKYVDSIKREKATKTNLVIFFIILFLFMVVIGTIAYYSMYHITKIMKANGISLPDLTQLLSEAPSSV